jgi:ParB family chromosome partitioning protein
MAEKLGPGDSVFYLEIAKIKPNPYQPRKDFNELTLKELADSVREYGVLEPLLVSRVERPLESGGVDVEYQLVAGERRLMAAKLAGLSTVPALIREIPDERMKLEIALIENLQREDLNSMEKARAFAHLADKFGLPQREIALRIGKSRESVANTMRLLQLPLEAQKALAEEKITEGHARAILSVPNSEKQRGLLEEILAKNLTVRDAEELARNLGGGEARFRPKLVVMPDPLSQELQAQLEEKLGAKVILKKFGSKGEIAIKFHTPEELTAIAEKLLGKNTI